ncbi:MAG TPA: hypothetical protein VGD63_10305 [Steroidobacteraceae bacterium]
MQGKKTARVLVFGLATIAAWTAHAAGYGFLAHTVVAKLTPQDVKIGTAAAVAALDAGQNGNWTNPATRASGTITIVKTLDIGGHKGCRQTRLDIESGGMKDHGTYILCRRSSGSWAFYSVSPR